MVKEFSNKVCIITGGATNIGKVIALSFAREGSKVVIIDIKQKEGEETLKEIEKYSEGLFINSDISIVDNIRNSVKMVYDKFGRIDILVNNAVLIIPRSVIDILEEEFDRMNNVICKATFFFSQEVAKIMKEQRSGKIINIATSPGENKKHTYHIPKAGVLRMTQAFAVKLAEFNINVNSVSPNFTLTDRHMPGVCSKETLEFYKNRAPMGRFVTMEDVANSVLFFASEKSSIINGQNLVLDGGWSVHA